jgi:hypothetical protein
MNVSMRTIFVRLLEALILSAIAGSIGYALTAWLSPPGISPFWAAAIVASVAALAILVLSVIIDPAGRETSSWSPPDTYYDHNFSVSKDESWND